VAGVDVDVEEAGVRMAAVEDVEAWKLVRMPC
jgi:hypothetical protein